VIQSQVGYSKIPAISKKEIRDKKRPKRKNGRQNSPKKRKRRETGKRKGAHGAN
jgi:hypothetical protein